MISRVLSCLALLLPTLTIQVQAQQWHTMREVVFGNSTFASTGSIEDREVMRTIWGLELASPRSGTTGKQLPTFTLLGDAPTGSGRIVFSMLAKAGNSLCSDAPNGAGATDIYNVCTMRVTAWPMRTGLRPIELPGYCMLYGNDAKDQNRVEYRIEHGIPGLTVRFRALQYGRIVPACNRAMQLG